MLSRLRQAFWTVLGIALGFLITCPAFAKDRSVMVSGIAPIIGRDISQARDEAIADALSRAVEQVVGIIVDSRTVTQNELLLESSLYTQAKGFVKNYEVIDQGEDKGLYTVKVKAVVSDDLLEDELYKLLKEDRVVIVTSEVNLGQDVDKNILEGDLLGRLTEVGYENIIDYRLLKGEASRALVKRVKEGRLDSALRIGLRFLADVVIVGRIESLSPQKWKDTPYPLFSAQARGEVKVFRVSDKKMLAAIEKTDARGFGSSEERAGMEALSKASGEMCDYILKRLTPRQYRTVKVNFYGIPDFKDYQKYKNLLSMMRFVKKVEEDPVGYNQVKSVFLLRYAEKASFLASRISLISGMKITTASEDEIKVEVCKNNKEVP